MIEEKRIVIAGGAGFIGFNLVKALLERKRDATTNTDYDWKIFVLDNQSTGRNWFRLLKLGMVENENLFKVSITNSSEMSRITQIIRNADFVINLACPAAPKYHMPENSMGQIDTMEACTAGVANIMVMAWGLGARVIHASSSEVYGECGTGASARDHKTTVDPLGPRSCYKEGKRMSETVCSTYAYRYKVPTTILRIFNTYGPYMDMEDGRAVPEFIKCLSTGRVPTVYEGTRGYMYISDLTDLLVKIVLGSPVIAKDDGLVACFNVGMDKSVSDYKLLLKIAVIWYGTHIKEATHKCERNRPGDVIDRLPQIQKTKDRYFWEPRIDLPTGLTRTIEWFKKENAIS